MIIESEKKCPMKECSGKMEDWGEKELREKGIFNIYLCDECDILFFYQDDELRGMIKPTKYNFP